MVAQRHGVKPVVRSKFKRWRSHVSKTFEPRLPGGARPSEFDKGSRLQRVIRAASRQLSYRAFFISRPVGPSGERNWLLRVTRKRAILAPARGEFRALTLRELRGQRARRPSQIASVIRETCIRRLFLTFRLWKSCLVA